ncbi:MAG TPA: cytochrome c oxidase subunit II [Xanthobacteraceae bacterium]|jgi:cytochrome c oxidase subunit 2|nr:MAG: cytochrome c oxidase subunit II [Rhizobiales bacterium 39-66-18]HQS08635.1 cytochrome c oxidase subunit II [Xanthobacteraceae bacterium]HQS48420.1 cytochrome c oxidase subunit II [Xanthobacteraceae bacterium]
MISFIRTGALAVAAMVAAISLSSAAWAGMGQPSDWQIGLQDAATPVMASIHSFNNFVLAIIVAIVLFVMVLLAIVMVRFNERANPVPSKTSHNTLIEVIWTVAPVMILVAIAIPSFRLLHLELNIPPADMTVKVTGHQWYWSYEYPDNGGFGFDSLMIPEKDLKAGQPRLLAVDNEVIVPVNKTVRIQVTAADVIHSFAVPSFGVKIDALPGRLNESWFKATKEGVYYGQCSELCGRDHAFMPIAVRVVSQAEFDAWIAQAKQKFSAAPASIQTVQAPATGTLVLADAAN